MNTRALIVWGIIAMTASASVAAERTYTVKSPPTKGTGHYIVNRLPLAPKPLLKLPIGSIRPEGWLRTQLIMEANGFTGRLTEVSPWCKFQGNAWVTPGGVGANGWEEVPYWLKGFGDLGYVLGDKRIIAETKKWLDGVISTQEPDGYFGSHDDKVKPDLWPNMPMLDALQSYYEFTGDERVIKLMTRYFRYELSLPGDILPGYWDKMRGGDNTDSIYWLYNRTGEAWLLDAAKKVHECTAKWSDKVVNWHGVNITQGYREPAIYFQQTHDPKQLAAAERNYQEVMGLYGQVPGGMFGADENARRGYGDPRQGAETCSHVEFMHSFQMLLGITGSPLYSDRCEEIAFNMFPATMTPDAKGLHYLTAPNQPQLDRESKSPGIENGGDMFSYNPMDYRCCQHNVAMGWPYYAEHLWMGTLDGGLAATLYSASIVTAKVGPGKGTDVTITQTTKYPFAESINFAVSPAKTVDFPLYLRVPNWCSAAKVTVNGKARRVDARPQSWIVLDRTWKAGDRIVLSLPMSLSVKTWTANKDAVSVKRGPLWYSLKIGEDWRKYGDPKWPGYEVFPTSPWNYGFASTAISSFKVTSRPGPLAAQPFAPGAAPISITAKARRIPNWSMKHGLVDTLKQSPVRSDEPVEDITLIPLGCTRLRMTALPVVTTDRNATEWPAPPVDRHTASFVFDDINAVSDGIVPASSSDETVPRFTWWNHTGTEEWITYDLGAERSVSSCSVYWFDDVPKGRCRVPASWEIFYKDGGSWEPVGDATPAGVEKDRFNEVTFSPVTTSGLKIVVKLRNGYSGGILEWKVK
ncbi:MAG TPA: beta-L-arabinofuranosidase domain-containing protein [Armatimonadota bacterium]|jgi:hypothetical protein